MPYSSKYQDSSMDRPRSRDQSLERYSKPHSSKHQDSSRDQPKRRGNEEKTGEKPFVYRSKGERAFDKLAKKDQKYEEHKTKYCVDWDIAREEFGRSSLDLKEVAQIHQARFEREADDKRAKTEVMPWAKHMKFRIEKGDFSIIKADVWTADYKRTKLTAGFDSAACVCFMKTSQARKLGLKMLPYNKGVYNMSMVPIKLDRQVNFSFGVRDSRGKKILSKPHPVILSEDVQDFLLLGLDWHTLNKPHFNYRERTFVWLEKFTDYEERAKTEARQKGMFNSFKPDIWTTDDKRTKLRAVFDSGAGFCMMKASRARAPGLDNLPHDGNMAYISQVEMKTEGQVMFSI